MGPYRRAGRASGAGFEALAVALCFGSVLRDTFDLPHHLRTSGPGEKVGLFGRDASREGSSPASTRILSSSALNKPADHPA
jgi:hypothetical protein